LDDTPTRSGKLAVSPLYVKGEFRGWSGFSDLEYVKPSKGSGGVEYFFPAHAELVEA
jgi:hypothetical protein